MMVPSGRVLTGRMFPTEREAILFLIKKEKHTLDSSVDVLSSVHSFNGDKILSSLLVSVRISEDNLSKWGSSAGIVNDVLDDSLNVSKQEVSNRIWSVGIQILTLVFRRSREF